MARMRTIKPEFWVDDKIVELSILAKLLYIGLWNFADDDGYMEASPRRIKRQIFPDNDYDVASAIGELLAVGMVQKCSSDQGELLLIVQFKTHQKPQHPTVTKYTNIHAISGSPHEDSGALMSPHPVVESSGVESSTAPMVRVSESDFERAWSHWPKKVERKKSFDKFRVASKTRGVEPLIADIIRFGDAYTRSTDRQYVPALNVWLGGERWTDELPGAQYVEPKRRFVAHAD